MKRGLVGLLVGRRHSRWRIRARRLRQRRQWLQFRARTIPFRSLYRIQLPIRRLVRRLSGRRCHSIRFAERRPARFHRSNIQETRRWSSRILRQSLRIPSSSSSSDELLSLRRVLHPMPIQKECESREHAERDNPNGDSNGNRFGRLGWLSCLWNWSRAIGRRWRWLTLIRCWTSGKFVKERLFWGRQSRAVRRRRRRRRRQFGGVRRRRARRKQRLVQNSSVRSIGKSSRILNYNEAIRSKDRSSSSRSQ